MSRETEAVRVDDVDVAGARCETVLQDARAFVGQRGRDPRDDLLVVHLPPRDAALRRFFGGEPIDQRIGRPVAAAGRIVFVPARAGFLPVAAHREQTIGHRRLRTLGARLSDRREVLANPRADVDPGDVLHAERSDRHAELGEDPIDLLDAGAFLEQQVRLAHVVCEHPVGDEAETVADDDADLAELLRKLQRRGDHLFARLAAAHDLEKLHHVRRAEEVVADDLCRTSARLRELVDVERRRIARENAVRTGDARDLGERRLLQIHVLEHRLDDDVDVVEAVIGRRRRDERHRALKRLRRHLALGDRRLVVPANRRESAVERRSVDFLEQHRNAGVGVSHGDPATHRAGADHRRPLDLARGRILRHVGNLGDVAFGEKQMHERARLGRYDAVGEQLALAPRAGVEWQREPRLDRADRGERRSQAARRLLQRCAD